MKHKKKNWILIVCGFAGLTGLIAVGCGSSTTTSPSASSQSTGQVVASNNAAAQVVGTPTPVPPQWGLQVASVNTVPDTQSTAFQESFKLINFSSVPQDASQVFAVAYFDVPQGDPNQVSFVNSTSASVFNPNGTPTGVNANIVLDSVGLFGPCLNTATGQLITSDFGFTVTQVTLIPANGGYLTFTPELWRNGVLFNTNNDWTAQKGITMFHFDNHIDLVFNGLGNVSDVCQFSAPGTEETVLNRCSNQPESCTQNPAQ